MPRLTWLFVLVFLIATEKRVVAQAQVVFPFTNATGAAMLTSCGDTAPGLDQIGCLSFLQGFITGFTAGVDLEAGATKQKPLRLFCLPEGNSLGQNMLVVMKWLKDHPERLHEDARIAIVLALENAFSCK